MTFQAIYNNAAFLVMSRRRKDFRMNKQELIKEIESPKCSLYYDDMWWIPKDRAINLVDALDEPQKVVIPQFVADKIEYCKKTGDYGLFHAMDYCFLCKETADWLEDNQNIFARAWVDGYEIEPEKLYTVEIPNTLGGDRLHLVKTRTMDILYICRSPN